MLLLLPVIRSICVRATERSRQRAYQDYVTALFHLTPKCTFCPDLGLTKLSNSGSFFLDTSENLKVRGRIGSQTNVTHFRSVSEYAFNVLVQGGPGQSRVARRAAQLGLTRLSRAAPHWRRRESQSQSERALS